MPEILSKFSYPQVWNHQRQPARPLELQVLDFEKTYDYTTLWNDVIQINPTTVLLIGPPLYNTVNYLRTRCKFTDRSNKVLSWQHQQLDRVDFIAVTCTESIDAIYLHDGTATHLLPVSQPSNDFINKSVIVTISKNHPITWLQQWIHYHKTVHNVEGFLIYNNQSSDYTSTELEQQLMRSDIEIKIVDYDVPFGTMGGGLWEWQGKSGTFLPWDSDFAQYVMLEHAKWRYLWCAKLAINADTDELLLLNNMTLDQFAEYCKHSSNSAWLYQGTWIEPVDSQTGQIANSVSFDQRHFKNYWHTAHSNQRGIGVKWMLNPQKNMNYQWMLHRTTGPHMQTKDISFAHYLAMNTSWSWKRDGFNGDVRHLVEMTQLQHNLKTAFG